MTGRLCTKDPISVFRQFLRKFYEFFSIFIKKGQVLGQVDHFQEKRVPTTWCSTLSCPPLDKGCP